jgi:hypothetical protein
MAHYAILDANNVVINVITGLDEGTDGVDWEDFYKAKRTSYNTVGGVYYNPRSPGVPMLDQSKAFRKNYAYIGGTYDPVRDAFIPPKMYPSWVLNEQTCLWEAPVPMPSHNHPDDDIYWDEENLTWVIVPYVPQT